MSSEMPNPSGLEEVEERLKKARNRRNGGSRLPFIAGGAAVLLAALLLIPKGGGKAPAESQPAQAAETQAVEPTLSPEEQAREARERGQTRAFVSMEKALALPGKKLPGRKQTVIIVLMDLEPGRARTTVSSMRSTALCRSRSATTW